MIYTGENKKTFKHFTTKKNQPNPKDSNARNEKQ